MRRGACGLACARPRWWCPASRGSPASCGSPRSRGRHRPGPGAGAGAGLGRAPMAPGARPMAGGRGRHPGRGRRAAHGWRLEVSGCARAGMVRCTAGPRTVRSRPGWGYWRRERRCSPGSGSPSRRGESFEREVVALEVDLHLAGEIGRMLRSDSQSTRPSYIGERHRGRRRHGPKPKLPEAATRVSSCRSAPGVAGRLASMWNSIVARIFPPVTTIRLIPMSTSVERSCSRVCARLRRAAGTSVPSTPTSSGSSSRTGRGRPEVRAVPSRRCSVGAALPPEICM